MKKIEINEINGIKTSFLPQAIMYWQDYDKDSVILTYLDMKRRQIPLNDDLQKKIAEFSNSQYKSIDELCNDFLRKNNVKDYSDLFIKKEDPRTPEELAEYRKKRDLEIAKYQKKGDGTSDMVIGGIAFSIGLIITLVSLSSHGGGVIAYGAIIFGLIRFIRGLSDSI